MILRWKNHQRSFCSVGTFQKLLPAKINDYNYMSTCTSLALVLLAYISSFCHTPVPRCLSFVVCFGGLMPSCYLLLGLSVDETHSFREQKEREGRSFSRLSPRIDQQRLPSLLVLVLLLPVFLVRGVVTSCHCWLSLKCLLILFASP